MTENWKDELYQLENKLAIGPKVCANNRWELEGKKSSQTLFKVFERQSMQNQTIIELYTDDNKSNNSCNPKDFFKGTVMQTEKELMNDRLCVSIVP